MEVLKSTLIIIAIFGICQGAIWESGDEGEISCATARKEAILEDRATMVDETGSRLHSTWLSQECEVRVGPEYIIRKYTFFENGTFLLLRHHYAEESCSVAMYTVAARGAIRLLGRSTLAPGATEARYQLDSVHIVPVTRQVAQKFSHRVNVSCSPQPRWKPYVPQLIYEQPSRKYSNFMWEGPKYNMIQRHNPTTKKHRGIDCLEPLGIEFGELRLVRVQKRPLSSSAFAHSPNIMPRVELLLGSLPRSVNSKKTHRSTSLQPTSLLRADRTRGCLVCGAVSRGTESSPPVLHEVADLPALVGGTWLSPNCESCEGGLWLKRHLEIYPGDGLWTGRWAYYADPRCTIFLYATTGAGTYIQRQGQERGHGESILEGTEDPSVDYNSQGQETQSFEDSKNLFRRKRSPLTEKDSIDSPKETNSLNDPNSLRTGKALAEWMTPGLARNIFEIYGPKKEITESMLPTIEEIHEAIGKSTEATVEIIEKDDVLANEKKSKSGYNTRNFNSLSHDVEGDLLKKPEDIGDKSEGKIIRESNKMRRSLDDEDSYRHLLQNAQPSVAGAFAAMLRGNQRREETTKKPILPLVPTGTTEIALDVNESHLIAGDLSIAVRCGAQIIGDEREVGNRGLRVRPLSVWPKNCVPHSFDSRLEFRSRVGINWSGQYTLLLGSIDDHLWEAPLQQCGPANPYNPALREHLERTTGLRYDFYGSGAETKVCGPFHWLLLLQCVLISIFFNFWR